MSETPDKILANTEEAMKKAINHLEAELVKVRAGKANPNMLDGIVVDYYGNPTPIGQVGNISVLDATLSPRHSRESCIRDGELLLISFLRHISQTCIL